MLPNKLRTLALQFKCLTCKGHFPHKFISEDNINYEGILPDIIYFYDISETEYSEMQL
jgi:DNA polymerase type B, organellar and viral